VSRGVFVTGTDTGVGKTVVACALVHALAGRLAVVRPMKPIAAGATTLGGRSVNEASVALMNAGGEDLSHHDEVTPILLAQPLAPHIAAAREGRVITLEPVMAAFRRRQSAGAFVVVEGVGGFCVPLGERLDTVDLARAIDLPVVLVVGIRLGCLNHALLTAQAIRIAGLRLAGWVANAIDLRMAAADENVAALETRLEAPLLGRLPHSAEVDARALARLLDIAPLIGDGAPF
jgi:dethiobiotin synthetase